MIWLATVLMLSLLAATTALAAQLGWRLGNRSKPIATGLAGIICLSLVAGAGCAWHASWLPECRLSAIVQLGDEELGTRSTRRQTALLSILTAVVLFAAGHTFVGPLEAQACVADIRSARAEAHTPIAAAGNIDRDGVVRQSVNYTCGAASCATLLRRTGIDPQATEEEMVKLCLTKRLGGTSTLGMAAGLKVKAEPLGWRVRIVEPDWESFCRLRKPAVCAVSYGGMGHAVVVCAVDESKGVLLADPIGGLSWWPTDQFKEIFQNEAVVVFRNDPSE